MISSYTTYLAVSRSNTGGKAVHHIYKQTSRGLYYNTNVCSEEYVMNKHRRFHRLISVVTVTLCVLDLTGIAFGQNNNNNNSNNKNNSGSSSHRRSLATSGASLTNNQNTQRPSNTNNTAKSADKNNKPSQSTQDKTTKNSQNKPPQNPQNKQTQQNAQNSRGPQGGATAQKSPSAAGQGQLRMVDKTMIEVLRTRKVDYDEDVASASPNVIILNKRVLNPEKSLIERESMLVRESKDKQLALEAAKIPDDMFEFLGALN